MLETFYIPLRSTLETPSTFRGQVSAKCKSSDMFRSIADLSSVFDDMATLCRMFCADDLQVGMEQLQRKGAGFSRDQAIVGAKDIPSDKAEEKEEDEEEEKQAVE